MNNEPVAWMIQYKDRHKFVFEEPLYSEHILACEPLYTHPAKTLTDDPLVNFKPIWQEKPELTLTDEEIKRTAVECGAYINEDTGSLYPDDMCVGSFARAILRKAQEK